MALWRRETNLWPEPGQTLIVRFSLTFAEVKIRALSTEDLEDMVLGATILSTGGGGSPSTALKTAGSIERKGIKPRIVDPKDLKKNALVFSPGDFGGGISKEEEERFEQVYKAKIPIKWAKWPLKMWSSASVKELAKHLGRKPDVYLSSELGPGAFMGVIEQAAEAGKPMIDGDTVGRAVPDATMSLLALKKVEMVGGVSTSHFGDVIVWKRVADLRRLEDIGRAFSTASGGGIGMAVAYNWRKAKKAVIPKTLSKCISLGKKARESKGGEGKTLATILKETMGRVLFKGRITDVKNDSKHGHLYGEYLIDGSGDYAGHNFRIWFKNENHVGWKDAKPVISSPDTITVYDPEIKQGLWNWDKTPQDHEIYVLGIPCQPVWRTAKGLELLGPSAFGFDFHYTPVESLPS